MKNRQVITIMVDGTMQGLQMKPGKGLDLTKFGPASVVRASEIVWNELNQKWFVDVLQDAGKGPVTFDAFGDALGLSDSSREVDEKLDALAPSGWSCAKMPNATLFFDSYDEAVQVEIAYLQGLRLQGVF